MLIELLERTRSDLHRIVTQMDETACRTKSNGTAWSVVEVVEHLIAVEGKATRLLGLALTKNRETKSGIKPSNDDQFVLEALVSRTTKAQAPASTLPSGRYESCRTALANFDVTREKTLRFARKPEEDLRSVAWPHPILGTLDGYQWLLVVAGHTRRHISQIEEAL